MLCLLTIQWKKYIVSTYLHVIFLVFLPMWGMYILSSCQKGSISETCSILNSIVKSQLPVVQIMLSQILGQADCIIKFMCS